MKKRHYDFVFSIGGCCACSSALREAGLQFASFPFDWLATTSIKKNVEVLAQGFAGLPKAERLEFVMSNQETQKDIYADRELEMGFVHDFPLGVPICDAVAGVREKYARRMRRLESRILSSQKVLAVYVRSPNREPLPDEDLVCAQRMLSEHFPGQEIDLLSISSRRVAEGGVGSPKQVSAKVFKLSLDYQSKEPGNEDVSNHHVIAKALRKWIGGVPDYRTSEERTVFRCARRAKTYAFYHATNAWQLLLNKMQWKLYRHLRKQLERRGFDLDGQAHGRIGEGT